MLGLTVLSVPLIYSSTKRRLLTADVIYVTTGVIP
jgi:hypothetical protein